jgi:hypothetical protein
MSSICRNKMTLEMRGASLAFRKRKNVLEHWEEADSNATTIDISRAVTEENFQKL